MRMRGPGAGMIFYRIDIFEIWPLSSEAAKRTDNGPVGTLPVSEAVPIAMKAAIAARPDCKAQIEAEVRKAYPNFEKDNRSMNGAGRPAQGDAKAHLEKGGRSPSRNNTRRR